MCQKKKKKKSHVDMSGRTEKRKRHQTFSGHAEQHVARWTQGYRRIASYLILRRRRTGVELRRRVQEAGVPSSSLCIHPVKLIDNLNGLRLGICVSRCASLSSVQINCHYHLLPPITSPSSQPLQIIHIIPTRRPLSPSAGPVLSGCRRNLVQPSVRRPSNPG
jgi:hypothetical protein